jgi:hypothetical protein
MMGRISALVMTNNEVNRPLLSFPLTSFGSLRAAFFYCRVQYSLEAVKHPDKFPSRGNNPEDFKIRRNRYKKARFEEIHPYRPALRFFSTPMGRFQFGIW